MSGREKDWSAVNPNGELVDSETIENQCHLSLQEANK